MLANKSFLGVIPARGGSKGIPGKNLLQLHGRSLLERAFIQASGSKFLDRVILSSEDPEIQALSRQIGLEVPFTRPEMLARDDSSSIDVVRHALNSIDEKFDFVVLLQVTSPLRISSDIDECISLCVRNHAPACVSVVESEMSPDMLFTLTDKSMLVSQETSDFLRPRRQDRETYFFPNGAVYVADAKWIMKETHFISARSLAYVMPKRRSIDLDDVEDWDLIQLLSDDLD